MQIERDHAGLRSVDEQAATPSFSTFRVPWPRRALLLSLCVQLVACSGGGASSQSTQGPGDVVWVAEGAGETNAEPLWSLRPGYRQLRVPNGTMFRETGEQSYDTILGAPIAFHGERLMPLGNAAWEGFRARGYPSEPSYWKMITQSESGDIWWGGTPRRGLFAQRLLMIPHLVRVGMKWASRIGGKTVLEGEVLSRTVQDTLFGERAVWSLQLLEHVSAEGGPASRTYSASFIEGRGPASFAPFIAESSAQDAGSLVIYPLEEVLPTPNLKEIALKPLNGGKPITSNYLPRHVSAYPDPQDPGTLIVTLISRGFAPAGQSPSEYENQQGCFRLSSENEIEVATDGLDGRCVTGSAWTFKEDGSSLRNSTTEQGAPRPPSSTCTDCPPATHQGSFVASNDRFATLATSKRRPRRPDGLWIVDMEDGVSVDDEFLGWMPIDLPSADALNTTPPTYPLHIEAAPGGDLRLLRPLPRMHFAHYDAEAGVTTAFEAYPRTGSYNVYSFHGGRNITTASLDGKIESLHLLEKGLGVRTLGRVRVPKGEFLTAALELDDQLLIFTQRGFEGIDAWYMGGAENLSFISHFGETMVYRADIPDAQPETPSNIWGLIGARSGRDALICWPNPAQQLKADWTLGGLPAAALLSEDGRCALLRRSGGLEDATRPSSWTVEGSVPGAGRVAIGGLHAARDMWPFAGTTGGNGASFAPVDKGGFVDGRGLVIDASSSRARYNNHLFEFVSPWWSNISLIFQSASDVAGHGLWVVRSGRELGDTHPVLALLTPEGLIEPVTEDVGLSGTLVTASEGGGALMLSHPQAGTDFVDGVRAFRPDGTMVTLATPSYADVAFRLADDTTCGISYLDSKLWCTSAAGVEEEIGTPTGDVNAAMIRPGDGVYWPAQTVDATQAIVLERYADGALEPVAIDLASLGLPQQAIDVIWRQSINGNIVGAVKTGDGGMLLEVKSGVVSRVQCDGPVDEIVKILHGGEGIAPYSDGLLLDVQGSGRVVPGAGCRLF